jgi:hypothetical protein
VGPRSSLQQQQEALVSKGLTGPAAAVWGGASSPTAVGQVAAAEQSAQLLQCAPEARLLGVLRSLVLYAADQPLALLCELALRQAAHDHAHPPYGIARSTCAGFSERSLRSCCSFQLMKPATCRGQPHG